MCSFMGRPRKWESDAERMAAKRAGASSVEAPEDDPLASEDLAAEGLVRDPQGTGPPAPNLGTVDWEGKTWPVVRQAHVTEAEYVGAEALATRLQIARGLKDHDGKRVERAKAYARYRYRGFVVGEIASL
jgi:hypothetical protein